MNILRRVASLLLVLPLMAGSRCVSEVDISPADLPRTLPRITQTGAGTFGFLINGRVWRDYGVTCNGTLRCDSNKVQASYYAREYFIYAGLTTKEHIEAIRINLRNISKPGTYTWAPYYPKTGAVDLLFDALEVNRPVNYTGRRTLPYSVTVSRLDTVQRIISGTFAGTFKQQQDSSKTIRIDSGRFDLRYRK